MIFDPSQTPPRAPRGLFLRVEQLQKVGAKKYAGPKKAYFLVRPVLFYYVSHTDETVTRFSTASFLSPSSPQQYSEA